MQAVRIHSFGGPWKVDDIAEPVAGDDQVVARVVFAGVNPLDIWASQGSVGGGQSLPMVLGHEAAVEFEGRPYVVQSAGIGLVRDGLYRPQVALSRSDLVELPDGVDLAQAAALPIVGATAVRLVDDLAHCGPGVAVLVLGASGGVGSVCVQLAKSRGAYVIAQTSQQAKAGFLESLGADMVLVANEADLTNKLASSPPDVVLDPLGGGFSGAALQALKRRGQLILYGASSGPEANFPYRYFYRNMLSMLSYSGTIEPPERRREALDLAIAELQAGSFTIRIGRVLELSQAPLAPELILERRMQGKLLIKVS